MQGRNMKNKIKVFNVANLVISCIIFILELMPEGVKMAWSNGPYNAPNITYSSYIMDPGLMLWGIGFLTLIIVFFTITTIIINAVILIDDSVKLKITSLVITLINLMGSVILVALMREYVTMQNIIIMVLLLPQAILYSANLRLSTKQKKLQNDIEE